MTQPNDSQPKSIKCPNCGHQNLPSAKVCIVCDSPLTYTSRFQRSPLVPTGLLHSDAETQEEHDKERQQAEDAEQKHQEEKIIAKAITDKHKTGLRCSDCGYNNRVGDYFCLECGANLSSTPSHESPADITQQMKILSIDEIEAHIAPKQVSEETVLHRPKVPITGKPALRTIESGDIPEGCFQFMKEMMLRLTDIESGRYTEMILKQNKPLLVGRSHKSLPVQPDVDLTPFLVEQHGVSRRHALLRVRDLRLEVQDLNSTNGTGINGFRFRPKEIHQLRHLDVITFGRISLQVSFIFREANASGNVTDKLEG